MKDNWLKKALTIGALCIIIPLNIQGQDYLNVPLIGQKKSKWCWAASVEMVTKFYNKSIIEQCDLVKAWMTIDGQTNQTTCCDDLCVGGDCDFPIPFSKRRGGLDPHYLTMLFSDNGYYAIEDINTESMDSIAIVREIQACRPFLIFLNKIDGANFFPYNHAVVAKGYYKFLNSFFVLVNDPLRGPIPSFCEGCEFLLPKSIFYDEPNRLNSALEVVRFIQPRDESICDNCDKKPVTETTDLVAAIDSNGTQLAAIMNDTIGDSVLQELSALLRDDGEPLYSSNYYFYTDYLGSFNVDTIVGLVANEASPPIAFILEKSDTSWVVKGITKASCTSIITSTTVQFIIFEENQQADTITMQGSSVEIVEIIPSFYQFYRVHYQGTAYLSPVQDYPALRYKAPVLYLEADVKKDFVADSGSSGNKVDKRNCFSWLFKRKKKNQSKLNK